MWKMPRDSQPPDECARFLPPGFTGSVACPVTVNGRGATGIPGAPRARVRERQVHRQLRHTDQEATTMSEQPVTDAGLPRWDLADRMRKSLRHAEMSVQEMADYLDVDRSTVSTWINNRIYPPFATQRLWAMRTGVPFEWLHHGDMRPCELELVDVSAGQGSIRHRANKMQSSQTKLGVA